VAKRQPKTKSSKGSSKGFLSRLVPGGFSGKRKLLGVFVLCCAALALLVCAFYATWASFFDIRQMERIPERSLIYDFEGKPYSRLSGQNRVVVPYEKVSQNFVNALLAREDTRFFKHHGVDPIGIARAMCRNLLHGRIREGGSTLTQQLALNAFLGGKHHRSFHRKLLEAFLALRLERNYTKRQILEQYMNRIYFGAGVFGIETASQAYFAKSASKLTLSEAALLAGIIRSPGQFSPIRNLEGAIKQRNTVLHRMTELGMISRQATQTALADEIEVASGHPVHVENNYAMDLVQQDLDTILGDEFIDQGGLRVYTTIDPVLQKTAQDSLDQELGKVESKPGYSHPKRADFSGDETGKTPYLQGAVLVLDNRTGGIRAIVGGRDYQESVFNRAFLSKRQIGSTFKPFVYAAAFDKGLSPDQPIDDGPIHPGEIRGGGHWNPSNSDGSYRGTMPAAEGLIQSRNTVSARVGNYAGIPEVQKLAQAVGLGDIPGFPSVFLGAFEATLKDLTSAYSVLPNRGIRRQIYIVERIDDSEGHVLYKATHLSAPAMNARCCNQVSRVLTGVLDHGTAASARSMGFTRSASGKTGTTNDYRDAWFVGYTQSLTCGVWVGLDKPQTIIAKGYGAALALPVWVDVMNAAPGNRYPDSSVAPEEEPTPSAKRSLPGDIFRSFRNLFRRR
jgi:penicillin-binding protein 1A